MNNKQNLLLIVGCFLVGVVLILIGFAGIIACLYQKAILHMNNTHELWQDSYIQFILGGLLYLMSKVNLLESEKGSKL